MKISIIAAVSDNGVIGNDGKLPWNLPADMKHFKEITTGHHIIMGRKTYESIGRPLPNRTNIVLTKNSKIRPKGCSVVNSLDKALNIAKKAGEKEVMVIGGSEIYKLALPLADKLYLTLVHENFKGDTKFPDYNKREWTEQRLEHHNKDIENPYDYSFVSYTRS